MSDDVTQTHVSAPMDPPRERRDTALEESDAGGRPLPDRIGRYEVERELGRGGVGVVYQAHDSQLDRPVALKTLIAGRDASPDQVQRFLRETRAAAHLRHKHIVAVHDAGEIDGCFYLAMELIEGEPLDGVMETEPLSPRRAVQIVVQIARALHYAHGEGFVHRDVKPENVLVDTEGEAYLTDFGLALDLSDVGRLTATHQSLGTPAFMAPEQLRGQTSDPRLDIYALGATLYECLTGQVPFPESSFAELVSLIETAEPARPRQLKPNIAADLEAVVLKCLEKDPERRYATAADLAADLDRFLAGEAVLASGPSWTRRVRRLVRRHRPAVFGAAVALLGVLGGGVVSTLVEQDAAAARRQKVHLEAERRRLLEARREAVRRFEQEEAKRLAFAEASLAATTEDQLAAFDRFLQAYPEEWSGRVARARLLRTRCHELRVRDRDADAARQACLRALEDLRRAAEAANDAAPVLLLMAELLRLDLKDMPAARQAYAELAASHPLDGSAPSTDLIDYARARLAFADGEGALASQLTSALVERRPTLSPARLLWAELLLEAGRAPASLEHLDRLVGTSSAEAEVVRLRARALLDVGNADDALRDALRAVELDPREPAAHRVLGRVRLAAGQPGSACASFDRSLALAPEQPDTLLLRAQGTLLAWKDLPKAIHLVSQARKLGELDSEQLRRVRELALKQAAAQGIELDAEVRATLGE